MSSPEPTAGEILDPVTQFSIIVISYKSVDRLKTCLESLRGQSWSAFETIVVNNDPGEQDAFDAIARTFGDSRFSFHSLPHNPGFAGGVNRGAERASRSWIATLNPDAYPNRDWLAQAAATIDAGGPDITMVASVQVQLTYSHRLDGAGDCFAPFGLAWRGGHGHKLPRLTGDVPVFAPCGAAAFYRRDAFDEVGGYCERFFCYFEDVDLALRLHLRGGRCLLSTQATVKHEGGVSSGGTRSAFAVRQGMRNMPQTFLRCMPLALLLPMLPFHIIMLSALLLHHAVRGRGTAALGGLAEAIGAIPAALSERRAIQRDRAVPLGSLAVVMSWNPFDALFRRTAASLRDANSG